MTAEDNGVPEDDDPFAYLYRQDGEDGAPRAAAPQQPGVPRTSYQQATQVGRAQYGQQRPPQPPQQQYATQLPHQTAQSPQPAYGGSRAGNRGGSGGGSNRAVMFGAIAVVVAVVVGVAVAMADGSAKNNASAGGSSGPSASTSSSSSASSTASASAAATAPGKTNVSAMTLGGGAALSSTVTNGASTDSPIDLKDWSGATTLNQAWQSSWTPVTLNAGSNTIELGYGGGSVDVDQFVVNTTTKPYPWN
jgi:hypothetical protein